MNILEYLRKQNVTIQAPCGGNGTCGKCLVSVDGGEPAPACRTEYRQGMRIEPVSVLDDIFVPGMDQIGLSDEKTDADPDNSVDIKSHPARTNLKTAIAIDIGTTTIVAALCEKGSGRIIAQESVVNPNAIFGADVISRIKAGSEGHGSEMSERLRGSLIDLAGKLYESAVTGDTILNDIVSSSDNEDNGRNANDGRNKTCAIEQADIIVIAGNTTMIHTLMDYDLKPLGTFPYEPVNIGIIKGSVGELLGIKTSGSIFATHIAQCVIFPGTSAFVGGDIISGLFALDEDSPVKKTGDIIALLDLGTNGEMAVVTPDGIYCASSAAGPVFEGGSIGCGGPSVTGAIDHVEARRNADGGFEVEYSVIGGDDHKAVSICGSGIIDCAYEAYRMGLCDERGTFLEDGAEFIISRDSGSPVISFTQADMRQVQLAKAAISAGFEILCRRAGVSYDDIDRLYLAGGMGYGMRIDSAVGIGLVPYELRERIIPAGNTSLKGALKLASLADGRDEVLTHLSDLAKACRNVDLAADPDFQDIYIDRIDLPPLVQRQ